MPTKKSKTVATTGDLLEESKARDRVVVGSLQCREVMRDKREALVIYIWPTVPLSLAGHTNVSRCA